MKKFHKTVTPPHRTAFMKSLSRITRNRDITEFATKARNQPKVVNRKLEVISNYETKMKFYFSH